MDQQPVNKSDIILNKQTIGYHRKINNVFLQVIE